MGPIIMVDQKESFTNLLLSMNKQSKTKASISYVHMTYFIAPQWHDILRIDLYNRSHRVNHFDILSIYDSVDVYRLDDKSAQDCTYLRIGIAAAAISYRNRSTCFAKTIIQRNHIFANRHGKGDYLIGTASRIQTDQVLAQRLEYKHKR